MICAGKMVAGRQYDRTAREVVLEALQTTSLSVWEMAELAERSHSTVMRLVHEFRERREIHIAEWRVAKAGPHVAVYGLGDFEDAPKPALKTNAERCLAYQRRRKIPKPKCRILRALLGA